MTGRASSFFFKGKNEDLRTIGQKLGVEAVLEGSVRLAGDRVRISVELVKVADGYRLWSESFDRRLTDVLALEDEIAVAVAGALKVRLGDGRAAPRRAVDPEAHTQTLLGKQFLHRLTGQDYRRSKAAFERAVEVDPGYAPAWAGLALATFWVADNAETLAAITQGYDRALAAAERAVALDPELADGYAARGFLRSSARWDWDGAREDVERALALNPGNAETYRIYAPVLAAVGRLDAALAAARKTTEIDPLDAVAWGRLGLLHASRGHLDLANAALDRSLEIAPEQDLASALKARVLLLQGRPAEAVAMAERSTAEHLRLLYKSSAHHDLGNAEESQRELEELIHRYGHSAAFQVADAYAWRGDRDRAFEWLERAYTQHDSGMTNITWDTLLRGLRTDPRWGALLRRLKLPED